MKDKERIKKHIWAARHWLDQAESWLERNNFIRTFSNFFLVIAELQLPMRAQAVHKKELEAQKRSPSRPMWRYALAASVVLALMALSSFYLLWPPQQETQIKQVRELDQKSSHRKKPKVIIPQKSKEQIEKVDLMEKKMKSLPRRTVAKKTTSRRVFKKRTPEKETPTLSERPTELSNKYARLETEPGEKNMRSPSRDKKPEEIIEIAEHSEETSDLDVVDLIFTAERALKGKAR